MKFIIRTDAARHIGTGHVMRCLTLAKALVSRGHQVSFISRAFEGNLIEFVRKEGFPVFELLNSSNVNLSSTELLYSEWLSVSEEDDFKQCSSFLADEAPDWLIIDHYALSERWENRARALCENIFVIDDLANRPHNCDLLLDQNYGSSDESYSELTPPKCKLLIGTKYALLRQEFKEWRENSLTRRATSDYAFEHVLVNLGGVDKDNHTLAVLRILEKVLTTQRVTVVMGHSAPHITSVQRFAKNSLVNCEVIVGASNMAEIMANSDLAIGAAGATSWERCCLGLPTILLVIAENQRAIATNLTDVNAVWSVSLGPQFESEVVSVIQDIYASTHLLKDKSFAATMVVDGMGADRVIHEIEKVL